MNEADFGLDPTLSAGLVVREGNPGGVSGPRDVFIVMHFLEGSPLLMHQVEDPTTEAF
jgi:hypothetical protein